MKKVIPVGVLLLLVALTSFADGQFGIKKGQVYLGLNTFTGEDIVGMSGISPTGIMWGSTQTYDGTSLTTSFNTLTVCVNVEVGWFVMNGLHIGLLGFQQDVRQQPGGTPAILLSGVGGEIGYILDLGGAVSPFVQMNAYFLGGGAGVYMIGSKYMPIVGMKVFLSRMVALDLGAFYSYSTMAPLDTSIQQKLINNYAGVRFGVSLFF